MCARRVSSLRVIRSSDCQVDRSARAYEDAVLAFPDRDHAQQVVISLRQRTHKHMIQGNQSSSIR